jgi:hypothetical protein
MAFIPEPYEFPPDELDNYDEGLSLDTGLTFAINDGATVITAKGLDIEGVVYIGLLVVDTVFSPNIPTGGLGGSGRRTYVY